MKAGKHAQCASMRVSSLIRALKGHVPVSAYLDLSYVQVIFVGLTSPWLRVAMVHVPRGLLKCEMCLGSVLGYDLCCREFGRMTHVHSTLNYED